MYNRTEQWKCSANNFEPKRVYTGKYQHAINRETDLELKSGSLLTYA